jgi:hypothetical protein
MLFSGDEDRELLPGRRKPNALRHRAKLPMATLFVHWPEKR